MAFQFYTSLRKGLKLKVRKFWGLILTFVEVTGEKLVGGEGGFLLPHPKSSVVVIYFDCTQQFVFEIILLHTSLLNYFTKLPKRRISSWRYHLTLIKSCCSDIAMKLSNVVRKFCLV